MAADEVNAAEEAPINVITGHAKPNPKNMAKHIQSLQDQ